MTKFITSNPDEPYYYLPSVSPSQSPEPSPTRSVSPSPTPSVFIPCADNCEDENICTENFCDYSTGFCIIIPLSSISCDDKINCTNNDVCSNGICFGTEIICDDKVDCTIDSCVEEDGSCKFMSTSDCIDESVEFFPTPTPSPSTLVLQYILSPIDFTATPTPGLGLIGNNSAANVQDNASNNENFPGDTENEIVSSSGLSYSATLIGALLIACACCFGVFFGVATNNNIQKDKDRLEQVLENAEETMDVENLVNSPLFS